MMKKKFIKTFQNSLFLILLFGCKASGTNPVVAFVDQFLEPVTIDSSINTEIGEMLMSDDGQDIFIKITNNSSDELRNLAYTFDNAENIFDFKPNMDGISESPGAGGTCQSVLAPHTSCTYHVVLTPRKQGEFTIPGSITYLNRVEAQKKELNYHLRSGQPASLVFTNDISNYNFGTFEQTEATERFIDFEVENTGGLPAKNLAISVNNDDIAGAYNIISHDCPKNLDIKKKCHIRVGYTPRNNNYSDPETIYTGQVVFDYIKDPLENTGLLNGYMSFTAATIEAKFKTNYAQVDFGNVVTGNKEMRMIKLSNMGYREGVLKELKFIKQDGSLAARCVKSSTQALDCQSTHYDFPFIIEDTNSCFGNEVVSFLNSKGSPNCIFKVTYWPSTEYLAGTQSLHNFNNSNISFVYDSKWKGSENIVQKDNIFNVLSNFVAQAKLSLARVELNGTAIDSRDIVTLNNVSNAKLGRIALIAQGITGISNTVKIVLKNDGEDNASLTKFEDGRTPKTTIIDVSDESIAPDIARNYNEYYTGIKEDSCLLVAGGGECSILFNITPVKKSSEAIENELMYDNITNPFNKFKTFIISYTDGSHFNDDGSEVTAKSHQINLFSLLKNKGLLNVSPSPTLAFGTSIIGDKIVKSLIMKNIGTGMIAAIQFNPTATLEVPSEGLSGAPSGGASGIPAYPYRLTKFSTSGETLPNGVDLDCFDLIRPSSASFPFIDDPNKILAEGKSCALRIEARLPNNSSTLTRTFNLNTDEYKRFWADRLSSTPSIYMPVNVTLGNVSPKFYFWDGDYFNEDPLSAPYFGYKASSNVISLSSSWSKPAMLYISKIEPVSSATLFRPSFTYPSLAETFPNNYNQSEFTQPIRIFANADMAMTTNLSATASRSNDLKLFYSSLGDTYYKETVPNPIVYAGSIEKSTDFFTTVSFANIGSENPKDVKIADANGDPGFSIYKFSYQSGSNVTLPITSSTSAFDIIFKINIATPGLNQHCYDLIYNGILGERTYKFCVLATVMNSYPKLKIEYKNNDVSWDSSTNSFSITPDANFTLLKSPTNKISTCDDYNFCQTPSAANEVLYFSTVYSTAASCITGKNCQFDMKTVKITNTGNQTAKDLKIDFTNTPGAYYATNSQKIYLMNATECANLTNNFASIQNKIAICASDITSCKNLAPTESCTIKMYYAPTQTVTTISDSMFVLSYQVDDRSAIIPGAYSYTNQFIPVKYEGLASASPVAYQYMRKGIDSGLNDTSTPATFSLSPATISGSSTVSNWSDPTNPNPQESLSFEIKLGTYGYNYNSSDTTMNSNYVLNSANKVMTAYINLKNTSSIRVSFLKANPFPASSGWSQVYPEWDYATNAFKNYNSNYGAGKARIYASEGCFFGELRSDSAVQDINKGFNSTTESFATKKCQLKLDFSGDITYSDCNANSKTKSVSLGGAIDLMCNPYVYKIPFWSFKRSTSLFFKIHLNEFIEPARSTTTNSVTNISTSILSGTTNAQISFTLPTAITENVPSLGAITKYRIFWAKDYSELRKTDIFKKTLPSTNTNICGVDTDDAVLPKSINLTTCPGNTALNISTGKYWFVKILAVRDGGSHVNQSEFSTFISDPKIPIVIVATPNNANYTYIDALKSFVDTTRIDSASMYNYNDALAKCPKFSVSVGNGGQSLTIAKTLVNFDVWSYIRNGTVPSLLSDYPAAGPGTLPHWLSNPAVAINSSSVKLYNGNSLPGGFPNFNTNNSAASNDQYKIAYNKGCTSDSCNNLNVIVGGDSRFTGYTDGVLYTYPTNKAAFVRCYAPLICPSNIGIKLNNINCQLKY